MDCPLCRVPLGLSSLYLLSVNFHPKQSANILASIASSSSSSCRWMRNARISLAGFAFVFLTLAFLTEAATHYGSTLATTEFPYRKKGCSGTDSVAYFGVLGSAIHCCTCSFSRCYGRSSLHEACVEELISTVKRASNDPSKFPLGARACSSFPAIRLSFTSL